ncbi:MAG: hypothetical protein Tsb0014_03800 [Pleurocapsa sp.]
MVTQEFNFNLDPNNPLVDVDVNDYGSPTFVDLDGDGDKDAFNIYNYSIHYYENDGNGKFTENTANNPFAGIYAYYYASLSFADIDRDGDLDGFISQGRNNLSYYENDGNNNFIRNIANNPFPKIALDYYGSPSFADMDGDGDLDAYTNFNSNLYYYKNDGNGNLVNNNPLLGIDTDYYNAPSFADLDGDGDLDAFTNYSRSIYFYENDGSGNFTRNIANNPLANATTDYYNSLNFIDFDGDGDKDIFTNREGTLYYNENDGSGNFTETTTHPLANANVGIYATPSFIDLDGDGDLDAFTNKDRVFYYYENDGNNNFTENANNPLANVQKDYYFSPTFVDFDEDGDEDAFTTYAGTFYYYENDGNGNFTENSAANPLAGAKANSYGNPTFVDLDGDGNLDAFTNYNRGIHYYENDGTGNLIDVNDNPLLQVDPGYRYAPTFADYDGDGDKDVFTNSYRTINYYENDGSGNYNRNTIDNPLAGVNVTNYNPPGFVDVNKDGSLDVFTNGGRSLYYYQNDGAGNLISTYNLDNPLKDAMVGEYGSPSFVDLDKDGDLDAFTTKYRNLYYYENDGNGNFTENTAANPLADAKKDYYFAPAFVDLDEDGDLDAFTAYNQSVYYYENDGNGNFTENTAANPLASVTIGYYGSPSFVDIDEDGDKDVFTNYNGTLYYYENDGNGNFTENAAANPLASANIGYYGSPSFIDADEDGDVDVFTVYGRNLRYYENDGSGNFTETTDHPLAGAKVDYYGSPSFADVDGDGDKDVFTNQGGFLHYYQNITASEPINGDAGNNNLFGGDGDDIINGEAGFDTLNGGLGNDQLFGGADDDVLKGGDGLDTLNGESGNDKLFGGNDDDVLKDGDGFDTLNGESGNDTLNSGAGNDKLFGGNDDDYLDAGDGLDTLKGELGNDELFGGNDDDILRGGDGLDTLNGESGNDKLFGGNDDDVLKDGDGFDTLNGESGNDILNGGAGNDKLFGGADNDKLFGGDDNDLIYGGNGRDTLRGDAGKDTLYGDGGNDRLFGGNEDDVLYGGEGTDTLNGGSGNNTLVGGGASDLFVIQADMGQDLIKDFETGVDRIGLSGISFDDLNIIGVSVIDSTLIQDSQSNEVLAVLSGVDSSFLTETDFIHL